MSKYYYQKKKEKIRRKRFIKDYELINSSDKPDESDKKYSDKEYIHYDGSEFNALNFFMMCNFC